MLCFLLAAALHSLDSVSLGNKRSISLLDFYSKKGRVATRPHTLGFRFNPLNEWTQYTV
jgi:hypothetical protein